MIKDYKTKIKILSECIKNNTLISVDGGINNNTIDLVKDYVDIVVSGSYITNSNNLEEQISSVIWELDYLINKKGLAYSDIAIIYPYNKCKDYNTSN